MFLPYGRQSINEDDRKAVSDVLYGDIITRGKHVEAFEEAFAKYVGAQYAVSFTSGSTALTAAYGVCDIGPLDKVLTTPNSFIATCAPATQKMAKILFADIDRESGNLDLTLLEDQLSFSSIKGRLFIVPVHFAGIAVDIKQLVNQIHGANYVIIEDAAHAMGSYYPDGEKVGSCRYSDMTIFSFHPVKTMTTGEGGMVTTNDLSLYQKLQRFRNSGIIREKPDLKGNPEPWYYEIEHLSSNFHMTDMQAALGLSQLNRVDQFIKKRRQLVERYRKNLENKEDIRLFKKDYDSRTGYHLMVVQLDFQKLMTTRTKVMNHLKEKGIGTQLHYIPLYRQPVYKKMMGEIQENFPKMEMYYEQALSLPLYYDLKVEEVDYICQNLLSTIGQN